MTTLKLTLEYIGTRFHGWQIQPRVPTVQGALQERLATVLRRPIEVAGAARTDAGVHAIGQVASFSCPEEVDPRRLLRSLNALLPHDVAVRSIEVEGPSFHARHSARGRRYRYQIATEEVLSPFLRPFAAHVRRALDLGAMREAARHFLGEHDFSAFKGAGDRSASPVKEIRRAELIAHADFPGLVAFHVEASGFLQYMVRNLTGTLLQVGLGRIEPDAVSGILQGRDRARAGPTAPAHGLCLMGVDYGGDGALLGV